MNKNTLILNQSKMQGESGFLKIPQPERNVHRDPRSKAAVGREGYFCLRNLIPRLILNS